MPPPPSPTKGYIDSPKFKPAMIKEEDALHQLVLQQANDEEAMTFRGVGEFEEELEETRAAEGDSGLIDQFG